MRKCIFILILIFLFSISSSFSQSVDDLKSLSSHCCNDHSSSDSPLLAESNGMVKRAFWFYKVFISSQDHQSCVFSPSCSEYAVLAVESQGLVKGILNTFDRMTRCHGLHTDQYPLNTNNNLLLDPVRNIKYEKP
jgi:putative component of membrane protein insertase Oxa1/YidC/SpoIIIJ protein YidD